jgi:hypothetical protein
MEEEWRDVAGYEGYYQVSNLGRIKGMARVIMRRKKPCSLKSKIRVCPLLKSGYVNFVASKEGKTENLLVHRLVATAFIPNPFSLSQVNHKDFDKTNNKMENLEWVSHADNAQHSVKAGHYSCRTNPNKAKVLTLAKVESMRAEYASHLRQGKRITYTALGKKFGCSYDMARIVIRNEQWR